MLVKNKRNCESANAKNIVFCTKYNSQLSNRSPIKFDSVESVSKDRRDNGTRMKYSHQISRLTISGTSANFLCQTLE